MVDENTASANDKANLWRAVAIGKRIAAGLVEKANAAVADVNIAACLRVAQSAHRRQGIRIREGVNDGAVRDVDIAAEAVGGVQDQHIACHQASSNGSPRPGKRAAAGPLIPNAPEPEMTPVKACVELLSKTKMPESAMSLP